MKYDKKIANIIKNINDESSVYLEQITKINKCSFTDSKVENIINLSKKLKYYHNKCLK